MQEQLIAALMNGLVGSIGATIAIFLFHVLRGA